MKGEVQTIGDRVVINPRTRLCSLRDAEGNVFDTFRLSLEVCGCGYSFARPGVGYGRLVLQAVRAAPHAGRDDGRERPGGSGSSQAQSLAGERVRQADPGTPRLVCR